MNPIAVAGIEQFVLANSNQFSESLSRAMPRVFAFSIESDIFLRRSMRLLAIAVIRRIVSAYFAALLEMGFIRGIVACSRDATELRLTGVG